MSESRHTVDELQRWMQAVVTHPGGVAAGIDSVEARRQIAVGSRQVERVVTRSQKLTALERLEIYNRAYFARLMDCLREEYSVLAAVLGNEIFDTFAIGYLQENPSRSYTLARLGANFPDFLEQTRPDARATSVDPPGAKLSVDKATAGWTDFLIDLTRLERTINEVFDGPGPEGRPLLDGARLTAITPEEWFQARLNCVPSLRLVRFRYPVNEFFTAIRRNEKPPIPEPEPSRLAISRRDFRVLRYPLEPAQYELLQAVLEGKSVGAAVERAAALSPLDDPRLAVAIREWFHFWTAEGFFRGVTTPLTS